MPLPAMKPTLPRSLAGRVRSGTVVSKYQKGSDIPNLDRLSVVDGNTVRSLRATNRIIEAVRLLARLDGILSTALFDMVQVAHTPLHLRAYDSQTHAYSRDGTLVARNVLAAMNTLYDYTVGYADKRSIKSVTESALRECALTGAVAGELVLDKLRYPSRLQIVPFETITFQSQGDGTKYPVQRGVGPEDIPLDIPNFWVIESHLGADSPYPRSIFEASLSTLFYYSEFVEDMRRVVRRSGHSRLVVTLDAARVREAAPESAKKTEAAMAAYMEKVSSELQSVISSLEPEDALVMYDVAKGEDLSGKGEKADYADLLAVLAGMAATSLKSHPSILGLRLEGSQSLSNTESLIFLKVAAAAQLAVSQFMSRALTLATRLYGVDVYVQAEFAPIDLRPEQELEAFRTMRQDRILDLLSIGMLSDDEAADMLGLPPLPPGAPRLSGTFFRDSAPRNRAGEVTPNSDPMGQAMQPSTPKRGGGRSQ